MVEEVRCPYCGKKSYTSSPRFVKKCSYCEKPIVKFPGKKTPGGGRRDDWGSREGK